jgi:OOP family OmpA-OmpF porin
VTRLFLEAFSEVHLMTRLGTALLVALVALAAAPPALAQTDVTGSKDYPGISRMPGYYIADYKESPFDSYAFTVADGNTTREQTVEGRRLDYRYNLKDGATMPGDLQVVRNYQNAARAAGGQVLLDTREKTTIRLQKPGLEVWMNIDVANEPSGRFITMVIIEKKAMQQEVTIDAKAMATDLSQTGRVAIYGILFDTGKADLKPESGPALAEIEKLLKANSSLKVYIVGHTDMVADVATNVKLSQARAQAVVNALVAHGIAAARLIPFGAGPYAPVATNRTEDGRAKNRRVELVEIATK